ncbi:hypothetical protein HQQ81_15590 [Microbacteriaceae bacterium VKM Ac-2854]|nr:hypothetical protein [Microbacteriaceae bacterium VKM Ac-2854]
MRQDRHRALHQQDTLGGAELWVLLDPNGLNAHDTVASLAAAYRAPAPAAGMHLAADPLV